MRGANWRPTRCCPAYLISPQTSGGSPETAGNWRRRPERAGPVRGPHAARRPAPPEPGEDGADQLRPDLEDYDAAYFAAMKAVKVAVRADSGLDNSLVGVALMRKAFQPHQNGKPGGPLADAGAEGGEQEADSALFAGAMGRYKNPSSHRTVDFDDPIEAAQIIQFADLLLRQVDRAKDRNSQ
ncbi:TIGR02391 family protein [Streptomyces sp. NPDC004435]|uniref:TIGR02391 family protein n=1 Tax=Streptomyces sp. NPDC004435 TaxID=3364701 RepID=UPI0036CB3FFB